MVEVYVQVTVLKVQCVTIRDMSSLQLPESLCYNQEVNFTILVESSDGDSLADIGPTLHIGPGLIKESVTDVDWKQNQTYSVTVILVLKTGSEAIVSEKYFFRKSFDMNLEALILALSVAYLFQANFIWNSYNISLTST